MKKWAIGGALLGAFIALIVFAPATWLATLLRDTTGERLLLSDARGTVWRGSALLVLTGGPDSHSASALPGRLYWRLGLDGAAIGLRAQQDCCIDGELRLRLIPGIGRMRLELPGDAAQPRTRPIGHWPASWLVGLGTPWNTLQPSGTLQLSSPGLMLEQVQGRWRFSGQAVIELQSIASRVSTLPELGSYRVLIQGDANAGDAASLQLNTTSGALQLNGSGQWSGLAGSKLRFNGQASAAPGFEAALSNLLNIIGRRQGAVSVISIG
ncbi:MAG: type II secretion system protein N [Pseudomonadota bacterium]|nr:type II secretion system protein N [Pseudomonadota bacterium]